MTLLCVLLAGLVFQEPVPMPNAFSEVVEGQIMLTDWVICERCAHVPDAEALGESAWMPVEDYLGRPHPRRGVWWLRTELYLNAPLPASRIYALCPEGLASATEVYWDGRRIAANGVVSADPESAKPGRYYEPVPIPSELLGAGRHSIVIRVSNHHSRHFWNGAQILFGAYDDLLKGIAVWQIKVYLVVCIFVMSMLLQFGLFTVTARKVPTLTAGLLCLLLGTRLLLENLWVFDTLDTTYYDLQQVWRGPATVLCVWAIPAAVCVRLHRSKQLFFGLFLVMPLAYGLRHAGLSAAFAGGCSLLLMVTAWRESAAAVRVLWLFLAVGGLGLLTPIHVGIDSLSWFGCWLVLGFNTLLIMDLAGQERDKQAALLRSARLENQMLKSSIKPHFLMNSLTSILVWMRRDPETAGALVQALAEEYRQLSQFAEHPLIPLHDELALCHNHLRIMSLRKGADYRLECEDVPQDAVIPPLVLHTLVENGLTHGYEKQRSGVFRFHYQADGRGIRFSLSNDGRGGSGSVRAGTGLKYVRARLAESYGSAWRLTSEPSDDGWSVHIEIDQADAGPEPAEPVPVGEAPHGAH